MVGFRTLHTAKTKNMANARRKVREKVRTPFLPRHASSTRYGACTEKGLVEVCVNGVYRERFLCRSEER